MARDLVETLDAVAMALHDAGAPYALCGGMAVNLHGHVRATRDIDILIPKTELERVLTAVRPLGFTLYAGPIPFSVGTPQERELHRVSTVEERKLTTIDLLVVTPVLERAWATRVRAQWREHEIWAVSLDGLGHMKRLAGRAQDIADLEALGLSTTSGES